VVVEVRKRVCNIGEYCAWAGAPKSPGLGGVWASDGGRFALREDVLRTKESRGEDWWIVRGEACCMVVDY